METERNQQRNQDGRTDGVRDGDSAAKRMEEGRLYFPGDEDILKEQMEGMELLYDYNATRPRESARRTSLLEQMFGSLAGTAILNRLFTATGEADTYIWGILSMSTLT